MKRALGIVVAVVFSIAGLAAQRVLLQNPNSTDLDTTAPTVSIAVPTSSSTYDNGTSTTLTALSGTSSDATGVATCRWSNALTAGTGTFATTGAGAWSASNLTLAVGSNAITVTCLDPGNNVGTSVITVTVSATGGGGTNPIASTRIIDWTTAGYQGTSPLGRVVCTTVGVGASAATVQAAYNACPAGQAVLLPSGTYNWTTGILMNRANVTIRGAGADLTRVIVAGDGTTAGCGGLGAGFCIYSTNGNLFESPTYQRTWTSGFTKGTTQITVSSTANMAVGGLLYLNQLIDQGDSGTLTDLYPEKWNCHRDGYCSAPGSGGSATVDRDQAQMVRVTSIVNATTVQFAPALFHDNWAAGRSPQVWYNDGVQNTGTTIEDLSIETAGSASGGNVVIFGQYNVMLYGIRSVNPCNMHVKGFTAMQVTIRFSYFFGNDGCNGNQEGYGIDTYISSSWLVESNIIQNTSSSTICERGVGTVWAYNYARYVWHPVNRPNNDWGLAAHWTHSVGCDYHLWEGNDSWGIVPDNYHGASSFHTGFRNRWEGWEAAPIASNRQPLKVQSFSRFTNWVGNVLGRSGFHMIYQWRYGFEAENFDNCELSIWNLGWGQNCDGNPGNPSGDIRTTQSMMRWGNWDVVTAGVANVNGTNDQNGIRFIAAEVPSGIAGKYANPVPSSTTLPASFYLSSKPAWVPVSSPWPLIGPDVSGGDVPQTGGHAYKIPARIAGEAIGITTTVDATLHTFNRATRFPGS